MKKLIVVGCIVMSGCASLQRMANTSYWVVSRSGEKLDGPYSDPIACYDAAQRAINRGYAVRSQCVREVRQ